MYLLLNILRVSLAAADSATEDVFPRQSVVIQKEAATAIMLYVRYVCIFFQFVWCVCMYVSV